MKYKQGEKEALQIIEKLGYSICKEYHDCGDANKKPDLMYSDGRFLEVTHTEHNFATKNKLNKYNQLSFEERARIEEAAGDAYRRIMHDDYEYDAFGNITKSGCLLRERDLKRVKEHYGYDASQGQCSEFNCDITFIEESSDNILKRIEEKGEKHSAKDIDLFIFATENEIHHTMFLIKTKEGNGCSHEFFRHIAESPFIRIFLCEWNMKEEEYDTENPRILCFERDNRKDDTIRIKYGRVNDLKNHVVS